MSTDNEVLWLVYRIDSKGKETSWVFRTRAAAEGFKSSRPINNRDKYHVVATKWGPEA